jgi:hypothetical protein
VREKILTVCLVCSSMLFSIGCAPAANTTQNAAGLVANEVSIRPGIGFSQNGNVDSGWYVGQVRAGHTIQVDSANKTVNIRIGYAAIDKTARSQSAEQGPVPATSSHIARIAIPVGWRVNLSGMGHTRWGGELGIAKVDSRGHYASSPILGTSLQSASPGQYVVLSSVRGPSRVVFDWISYSNTIHVPMISYDYV